MYEASIDYQPALMATALFFFNIANLISHCLSYKQFKIEENHEAQSVYMS